MNVEVREEAGRTVISLSGDVDLENSPRMRDALLSGVKDGKGVLVDLSAVEYIDSSGIAGLVEAYQEARKQGSAFGLAAVSAAAHRVLKLARLDHVFTLHDSVEAGLKSDA